MLDELIEKGYTLLLNGKFSEAIDAFQAAINSDVVKTPHDKATLNYCLGIAQLAQALTLDAKADIEHLLRAAEAIFITASNNRQSSLPGLNFVLDNFLPDLQTAISRQDAIIDKNFCKEELDKLELFFFIKFEIQQQINSHKNDTEVFSRTAQVIADLQKIMQESDQQDKFYFSQTEINKLYSVLLTHKEIDPSVDRRLLGSIGTPRYDCYLALLAKNNLVNMQSILRMRSLLRQVPSAAQDLMLQLNPIPYMNFATHFMNILFSNEECGKSVKRILHYTSQYNIIRIHAETYDFLVKKLPHPNLREEEFRLYCDSFFKIINDGPDSLKETAIKFSNYIDILAFMQHPDNQDLGANLPEITGVIRQAEARLDLETFAKLIDLINTNLRMHSRFLSILSWVPCLGSKSLAQLFDHLREDDWGSLQYTMQHIFEQMDHKKQSSEAPEVVFEKFKNISPDVKYPLGQEELKDLRKQFLVIKASKEKSFQEQEKCFEKVKNNPPDQETKLLLIAILCQRIGNFFEITPYDEQIVNVLALLNEPKRLAQIKTNEGKSTIIAILAAYFALTGRSVDIVSTHKHLAIRDALRFGKFYRSLDLTFGHNVREQNTAEDYRPQIIYGTNTDFEFSYLREATTGKEERKLRPYDVVIVDEVDSMFIDMQSQEAITTLSINKAVPVDIYHKIWQWFNTPSVDEKTPDALLKENFLQTPISIRQAEVWIHSVQTAQQLTLGKDYVISNQLRRIPRMVDGKKTEIVDSRKIEVVDYKNTGQVISDCRWQDGLHCFLELKHGLEIEVETYSSGSISHIEFFNKYETLLGMTGTLGTQAIRDELKTLYKVNCYDSPPHRPNRKTTDPFIISRNDEEHFQNISASTTSAISNNRAVLILCETINEANALFDFLKTRNRSVQIYTGLQQQSAENILTLAGNSGMITIATNNAGRGADIVATQQTAVAGGLRLIITFQCANYRVEWQAFSRTGRQDSPGSYQYILPGSAFTAEELSHDTAEKIIEAWQRNRDARSDMESAARVELHNILHIKFITQEIFFSLEKASKLNLLVPWALHKAAIQEISRRCLSDPTQSGDDTIKAILTEFFKFWDDHVITLAYTDKHSPVRQALEAGSAEAIRLFTEYMENQKTDANNKTSSASKEKNKIIPFKTFFSSRPELTKSVRAQNEYLSEHAYSIHQKSRAYSDFSHSNQSEVSAIMADTGSSYFKYRAISRTALRSMPGGGGHRGAMEALSRIKTLHGDCIYNNLCTDNEKIDIGEVLTCHTGEYGNSAFLEAARAVCRGDSSQPELAKEFKFIMDQIPEYKLIFALDSPDIFGTTVREMIGRSGNEACKKLIALYKPRKYISRTPEGVMSTLSFYVSSNQEKVIAREAAQFKSFDKILSATPHVDATVLDYLKRLKNDKTKNRIQIFLGAVLWYSQTDLDKNTLALNLINSLTENDMGRELLPEKKLIDLFKAYWDKIENSKTRSGVTLG